MFGEEEIFGNFKVSIDERNRIVLPSFTHAEKGDKIIIQKDTDGLIISNELRIIKIMEELEEALKFVKNSSEGKIIKEKIDKLCISILAKRECDRQKRIIMPDNLVNTNDSNKMMAVGYGKYIKLFTLKKYNQLSNYYINNYKK